MNKKMMNLYNICGLRVISALELVPLTPIVCDNFGQADIQILVVSWADVSLDENPYVLGTLHGEKPEKPFVTVYRSQGGCILEISEWSVRLFISHDGRLIKCGSRGRVSLETLAYATVSFAISVAMHFLGMLNMHGGAIAYQGYATLILGPSQAGKSSLVTSLFQSGCMFITDDVVTLCEYENRIYTRRGDIRIKLWPDMLSRLFKTEIDTFPRVVPGTEKRKVDLLLEPDESLILVGNIFVLSPQGATYDQEVSITPLEGRDALITLIENFMNGYALPPEVLVRHMSFCKRIIAQVKAYRVIYRREPLEFQQMERVIREQIGLNPS